MTKEPSLEYHLSTLRSCSSFCLESDRRLFHDNLAPKTNSVNMSAQTGSQETLFRNLISCGHSTHPTLPRVHLLIPEPKMLWPLNLRGSLPLSATRYNRDLGGHSSRKLLPRRRFGLTVSSTYYDSLGIRFFIVVYFEVSQRSKSTSGIGSVCTFN